MLHTVLAAAAPHAPPAVHAVVSHVPVHGLAQQSLVVSVPQGPFVHIASAVQPTPLPTSETHTPAEQYWFPLQAIGACAVHVVPLMHAVAVRAVNAPLH